MNLHTENLELTNGINPDELLHIILNMRERDHEELMATRRDEDEYALLRDCLYVSGLENSLTIISCYEDIPTAIMGAAEPWPGVWDVWCFGTDDFDHVIRGLSKWAHRTMIPMMLRRGMHRAHCRTLATHTKAHEWLRTFASGNEILLKAWGKNGEDFIMFEWQREELLRHYKPMEDA